MSEEVPLDEKAVANLNPETIEEIKDSITRIEKTLYESHQVLYGDEDDSDGEAFARTSHTPRDQHEQKSSQLRSNESTMSKPFGSSPDKSSIRNSSVMNGHNHSNRNSISRKQIRELQEMPASARGQRISELKKRGEPVPDLEEGVDENDNAQDISIDDLKARIKRELEEYRKNGPLMLRRKSANVRRAPRKMTAHQTPKRPPVAERPTPGASPAPRKPSGMSPSRKPSLNAPPKRNQNIKSKSAPPPPPVHASRPVRPQPVAQSEAHHEEKGGRVPVWERLYKQASVQRENQARRREQVRQKEAAPYPTKQRRSTKKVERTTAPAQRQSAQVSPPPAPVRHHADPVTEPPRADHSEVPNKVTATRSLQASYGAKNPQRIPSRPAQKAHPRPVAEVPPQKVEKKVVTPTHPPKKVEPQPQKPAPAPAPAPERSESKIAANDFTAHTRGYSLDSTELGENIVEDADDTTPPPIPSFVKPLDLSGIKK